MRRALLDMRPDRFEDIIALVALYRPGPMANIPTYCARKHGAGAAGLYPSQARADPARDLRRHHLSGTGDAGARRSSPAIRWAKPTSCAAPWARRSARRWRRSAAVSSKARPSAASTRRRPTASSMPARAFRRIRLQQEPRRGLCAGRLSDRLYEGELPGRVHGGVDDARHGQYRQARRIPRRGEAARHRDRAALDQPFGTRLQGGRQQDLLCARRAERRRHAGGRSHCRGAWGQALHRSDRFRLRASIRAR